MNYKGNMLGLSNRLTAPQCVINKITPIQPMCTISKRDCHRYRAKNTIYYSPKVIGDKIIDDATIVKEQKGMKQITISVFSWENNS